MDAGEELIQSFEDSFIPSVREFLGEEANSILNDPELRNAFFAGIRYSEFHEDKFGERP